MIPVVQGRGTDCSFVLKEKEKEKQALTVYLFYKRKEALTVLLF